MVEKGSVQRKYGPKKTCQLRVADRLRVSLSKERRLQFLGGAVEKKTNMVWGFQRMRNSTYSASGQFARELRMGDWVDGKYVVSWLKAGMVATQGIPNSWNGERRPMECRGKTAM